MRETRVLIADDQTDVLEALSLLLKRAGIEAVSTTSPAAIEQVLPLLPASFEFPNDGSSTASHGPREMQTLLRDIAFGVRILARQRLFTVVAVSMLASATGANTAIFIRRRFAPTPARGRLRCSEIGDRHAESGDRDDRNRHPVEFNGAGLHRRGVEAVVG